jgi:hypothetical protein
MCEPLPNGSGTCRAGIHCPLDHPKHISGNIWQAASGVQFIFTDPKYIPAEAPKPKSAAAIARAETKAQIRAARKASAQGIPFGDWPDTQDDLTAQIPPDSFQGTFAEISERAKPAKPIAPGMSYAACVRPNLAAANEQPAVLSDKALEEKMQMTMASQPVAPLKAATEQKSTMEQIDTQIKQVAAMMTTEDFDAAAFDAIESNITQELAHLTSLVEQLQKQNIRLNKFRAIHAAFK